MNFDVSSPNSGLKASMFRELTASDKFLADTFIVIAAHLKNRRDAGLDLDSIIRESMAIADSINRDHAANIELYRNITRMGKATK